MRLLSIACAKPVRCARVSRPRTDRDRRSPSAPETYGQVLGGVGRPAPSASSGSGHGLDGIGRACSGRPKRLVAGRKVDARTRGVHGSACRASGIAAGGGHNFPVRRALLVLVQTSRPLNCGKRPRTRWRAQPQALSSSGTGLGSSPLASAIKEPRSLGKRDAQRRRHAVFQHPVGWVSDPS